MGLPPFSSPSEALRIERGAPHALPLPQPRYHCTMTTTSADPTPVFADARSMHSAALQRMAAGDLRDAADKAWCAAKRATDALILARTGNLSPKSPDITRSLLRLAQDNPELRDLVGEYTTRRDILHGDCFYTGLCEPIDAIQRLVRETEDFIHDAETLAHP